MPAPVIKPSKYVSYTEMHEMTGLSRSYLRVLKSRGALPTTVHPEFPVWLRKDIERWLEKKGTPRDDT